MIKRLLTKLFSRKETENDITEKEFGNVVKFRIGSTVSLSQSFLVMIEDELLFSKLFETNQITDLNDMIVDTILSYQLDGLTLYRLYCSCIGSEHGALVQIQEEQNGSVSYMVFLLTQETALQDEDEYNHWYKNEDSVMRGDSIVHDDDGELYEFNRCFGPLKYQEVLEADGSSMKRPTVNNKTMSLFDRKVEDSVEYMLFDAELDNWLVEGFIGLDVPSQEVTIK